MALKIGASLTLLTVKLNVSKSVSTGVPVSVTVIVKFDTPNAFETGVTVAVQFGTVPLNTTFATGTKARLLEPAVNEVAQLKTSSTSVIVKLIAKGVSSLVV